MTAFYHIAYNADLLNFVNSTTPIYPTAKAEIKATAAFI